MQPQQQQQQQPGVVQQTSLYRGWSVVDTYAHRQSTVVGALLVIAGALSIIVSIVDMITLSKDFVGWTILLCGALVSSQPGRTHGRVTAVMWSETVLVRSCPDKDSLRPI